MRCDVRGAKLESVPTFISIHAPRMRCDRIFDWSKQSRINFNPRTSYEMRRLIFVWFVHQRFISIHAPRMRCDSKGHGNTVLSFAFQSTHLVWDATIKGIDVVLIEKIISIHAPRMRCDVSITSRSELNALFQSTHLVWDATVLI